MDSDHEGWPTGDLKHLLIMMDPDTSWEEEPSEVISLN